MFKLAHEDPGQCHLDNNRHKEQARTILESVHVNNNLCEKDNDKHESSEKTADREHRSETLSGSVVIRQDCLHHGEEGDAHRADHKVLELNSKTIKVVLFNEEIKTDKQDSLNY